MDKISSDNLRKVKLSRVAKELGLTYLDSIDLIKIDSSIKVACWIYNSATQKETILINPQIIDNYSEDTIEMVLRHEILHRSLYNSFNYKFDNKKISDIALDIIINKILYLSYKEKSQKMFTLYNEESYSSIIVLCIAGINTKIILNAVLKDLWKKIWENDNIPSPETIYYKLLQIEKNIEKEKEQNKINKTKFMDLNFNNNPFGKPNEEKMKYGILYREMRCPYEDKGKNEQLNEKVISDVKIKTRYFNGKSFFNEYCIEPKKTDVDKLNKFIDNLRYMKEMSQIVNSIKNKLIEKDRIQVYPMFLSRIGLIYNAMGINEAIPLYWNKNKDYIYGTDYKIALYIDTSGSMLDYSKYICWIIMQLDIFPFSLGKNKEQCYGFDTKIYSLFLEDIISGKFKGGGGTDYNIFIKHFLSLRDASNIAIIFTDGKSSLKKDIIHIFKMSKYKKIYTIYFSDNITKIESPLDIISEKTFTMIIN